jgi:hypothetical protein
MERNAKENPASRSSNDADGCPQRTEAHAAASSRASTNRDATAFGQIVSIDLPDEVTRRLRECLGVYYECWFLEVKVISVDNKNGILTLSATGNFVRDWMQSHYDSKVIDAWNAARRTIGGPRMTRVEFRTVFHAPTS